MDKQIEILRKFEQEKWVTKSKESIKIKDLELNHLRNIVNNLKKKFDSMEDPMNDYPSFSGEMAQMQAEREWGAHMEYYEKLKRNLDLFTCYYKLKSL